MPKKSDDSRDWKRAAERCLVVALKKAEEQLTDGAIEKLKATESVIKTVGDVVGAGLYIGRARKSDQQASGGDDDE